VHGLLIAKGGKRGRMDGSRARQHVRRGGGRGGEKGQEGRARRRGRDTARSRSESPKANAVRRERIPPIVVTIIFADDPTRRLALYLYLILSLSLSLACSRSLALSLTRTADTAWLAMKTRYSCVYTHRGILCINIYKYIYNVETWRIGIVQCA